MSPGAGPGRRVAFYAPLKEPDHPVPSGDRQMARLLVAALRAGGHEVELVSRLRAFAAEPEAARRDAVEAEADREVGRIAALWSGPGRGLPDLWFTYHSYYKAPDLLGPVLGARFSLPYVCAEASHAAKRAAGPWAGWHAASERAIRAARLHFCFTRRDRAGLAGLVADPSRLVDLPPFIDPAPFVAGRASSQGGDIRLVTVAMMRPGDKSRSYAFLARAVLALPADPGWHLTVIGDGPARDDVRALFDGLPAGRVEWMGELTAPAVVDTLRGCDLYVWPGFGEAYGLGYLEAQAVGLPVLAMACCGVPSVVEHGRSGLLAPEGALDDFVAALRRLMGDPDLRDRLGRHGRRFVTEERTVARAGLVIGEALARVVPARAGVLA